VKVTTNENFLSLGAEVLQHKRPKAQKRVSFGKESEMMAEVRQKIND
jgi:hypothetical protein